MSCSINTGIQVKKLMNILRVKSETVFHTDSIFPKPGDLKRVECVYIGIMLHWLNQTDRRRLAAAFSEAFLQELNAAVPQEESAALRRLIGQVYHACEEIQSGCSHAGRNRLDLVNIGFVFGLTDVSLKYFPAPATEESRSHGAILVTSLLGSVNEVR